MAIVLGVSQRGMTEICLLDRFEVDTSPSGLDSVREVFCAADRRCGLTEGTVIPHGAPPPGKAW